MRKAFYSPEFEESLNDKAKGSIYLFSCLDNNFSNFMKFYKSNDIMFLSNIECTEDIKLKREKVQD